MKIMNKSKIYILFISIIISLSSCTNGGRGYEYMPNMYRSPSLDTYGQNTIYSDSSNARKPVKGTIPRGKLLTFNYEGSLEGYLLAGDNVINPYASSSENIEDGKKLYAMFCTHCHGDLGDGKGSINHPVYSAIPAYNDNNMARRTGGTMSELKAGHIFHAITYGLNAMGPHASQLSEEERWKIVLYVQTLQQTSQK